MPDYEALMRQDVRALANQYAFYPSDRATGFTFGADAVHTDMTGAFAGFQHSAVINTKTIARVKLELKESNGRGEALCVTPSLTATTGVPVYFLPWDERGAAVCLTIPNASTALPEDQHPSIFFTAVLSGCMIAFKGTQQNPTIYHCGTAGGEVGTATGGANSNKFFKDLLAQANVDGISPGAVAGKIKSTDYMVTNLGTGRTDIAPNVERDLKQRYGTRIVKYVSAWGVCFGKRTGTDWKFYHQVNASIFYTQLETVIRQKQVSKKGFLGVTKTRTEDYPAFKESDVMRVAKPIEIVRVFPGTGTIKQIDTISLLP
jgi:hypothetical protein